MADVPCRQSSVIGLNIAHITKKGNYFGYDGGPLHTGAKSRDHDILRAHKKVSEGRPNAPPKSSCSVVTDPQV